MPEKDNQNHHPEPLTGYALEMYLLRDQAERGTPASDVLQQRDRIMKIGLDSLTAGVDSLKCVTDELSTASSIVKEIRPRVKGCGDFNTTLIALYSQDWFHRRWELAEEAEVLERRRARITAELKKASPTERRRLVPDVALVLGGKAVLLEAAGEDCLRRARRAKGLARKLTAKNKELRAKLGHLRRKGPELSRAAADLNNKIVARGTRVRELRDRALALKDEREDCFREAYRFARQAVNTATEESDRSKPTYRLMLRLVARVLGRLGRDDAAKAIRAYVAGLPPHEGCLDPLLHPSTWGLGE